MLHSNSGTVKIFYLGVQVRRLITFVLYEYSNFFVAVERTFYKQELHQSQKLYTQQNWLFSQLLSHLRLPKCDKKVILPLFTKS